MIKTHYKWLNKETKDNDNITIKLNPIIKKILLSRGIDTDEKIKDFLESDVSKLDDPFKIKDMKKACDRIITALKNKEKVMIYGDYDVDGISSTTVLFSYFKKIGMDTSYYIPNRVKEGYGINEDAIRKIAEEKYNLIVTVDTGITAINEAKLIKELGMDLVITDHHEVIEGIPDACAVVDLKQDGETYEFKDFAGVGTAFKTVCALDKLIREDNDLKDEYEKLEIDVYDYLDIVCLGTISDIVPLLSENRILTSEGIKKLEKTNRIGLKLLVEETINKEKGITAKDIAFMMVPKLNAAGRIDDASICVELLCEEDETKAKEIVKNLLDKNTERKKVEDRIFNEAIEIIDNNKNYDSEKIIVVKNVGWHHGVIGIVASKIAEKYFKPVVIFTEEDGMLSGSARTMGCVNVFDILEKGKDLLTKFGGHEGAAGLSLSVDNYDAFKKCIVDYADGVITDELLMPQISYDLEINADEISLDLINDINKLEPFGACNEEPVFMVNAKVTSASLMGKNNDHLRLKIKGNENSFDCIGFYKSDIYENIVIDKNFLMVGTFNINEFMGSKKVQMMLSDIKNDMSDEIDYFYYKSLYDKAKYKDFEDIINSDNEELKCNNIQVVNSVDNFIEMIKQDILDYNNYDENSKIKLYVINNKDDILDALKLYENDIKIFYNYASDMDIKNSINNERKKVILLVNNITKLVDLRKNYSIIYIDSLDASQGEKIQTIFGILKDDVTKTYKRLSYLEKINKLDIYLEDLLYNLRELNIYKILISLEILKELGIINYDLSKDDFIKFKINEGVKNSIDNSVIYKLIRKG